MKIMIEFVGGCLDGDRIEGCTDRFGDLDQIDFAAAYYELTDEGELGYRFWVMSELARDALSQRCICLALGSPLIRRRHYYEVISRIEDENSISLRVCFVGSVQLPQEAGN